MAGASTATIDTVAKASRYLSGLGGSVGFDEAVRRVKAKSSAEVGDKLTSLAQWVKGDTSDGPTPELALLGNVVKHAFERGPTEQSIGATNLALQDARDLSDFVRAGISEGLGYAALLLSVAAAVSLLWLTSIAPAMTTMYSQMASSLPEFTQVLVDLPWLIFAIIAALGLALFALVAGLRQVAARIESIAPLASAWLERLLGARATWLHERWRALTMARAWAASGEDPLAATVEAARVLELSPERTSALVAEIQLAAELGGAEAELAYQARDSLATYRSALELRRTVGLRLIQVAMGLLVGVIVLAIYLPIFGMGAVV